MDQGQLRISEALRRRPLFLGSDPMLAGLWILLVILQMLIVKTVYSFFFGLALLALGPTILRKVVERDPLSVQTLFRGLRWRHFYRARSSAYHRRITRRQEFRLR